MKLAPEFVLCAVNSLFLPESLPTFIVQHVSREETELAARFGQIHPILVAPSNAGTGYVIQGGILHFLALKRAGLTNIFCRITGEAASPQSAFALRILHEQPACQNSPILQALLIKAMDGFLSLAEQLSLLPLMGLKAQQHILAERLSLLQLNSAVQEALHTQELHSKNINLLARLPTEEQKHLVELISRYHLRGSKQQKLLELMAELHLRDGSTVSSLLAEWQESEPPQDNLPQESQNLLNFLFNRYNPRVIQAEQRFHEQVRGLQAPAGVNITHTPAFEDEAVTVQLSYSSWAKLQAQWPHLLKLTETGNPDR